MEKLTLNDLKITARYKREVYNPHVSTRECHFTAYRSMQSRIYKRNYAGYRESEYQQLTHLNSI